jgi:hypothetical protein
MGFEVCTRLRANVNGKTHERETSRTRAADETAVWIKISELAQERLVGLAESAE